MRALISLLLLVFIAGSVFATAKTLPAGVVKMDLFYNSFEIANAGVNPSGDKETWFRVALKDAVMNDIKLLQDAKLQLDQIVTIVNNQNGNNNLTNPIDLTTKVAHSWQKDRVHLDLAYGLTDQLTIFVNASYENTVLDYTDAYYTQSGYIEQYLGFVNQADRYTRAPQQAEGHHMNDLYMGIKYGLSEDLAVALKVSAGFLRIGTDAREKTYIDGKQELETGKTYDDYQLFVFYDTHYETIPLNFTLGYVHKTEGYQRFLDNDFDAHFGDIMVFGVSSINEVMDDVHFISKLTYLLTAKDKEYNETTGVYDEMKKSDSSTIIGEVGVEYRPYVFLRTFLTVFGPLYNDYEGQLYDFPGRLEPGLATKFGMTLFYR